MGLVSEVVADAEVEKARGRAGATDCGAAAARRRADQGMRFARLDGSLDTGLALETKAIQMLFASQDQKEGMAAFIEKRNGEVSAVR
jgi:enoyl-CoA hydratase/carnithine racemase